MFPCRPACSQAVMNKSRRRVAARNSKNKIMKKRAEIWFIVLAAIPVSVAFYLEVSSVFARGNPAARQSPAIADAQRPKSTAHGQLIPSAPKSP